MDHLFTSNRTTGNNVLLKNLKSNSCLLENDAPCEQECIFGQLFLQLVTYYKTNQKEMKISMFLKIVHVVLKGIWFFYYF